MQSHVYYLKENASANHVQYDCYDLQFQQWLFLREVDKSCLESYEILKYLQRCLLDYADYNIP